jgi:glucan phosphoethanolaminetransferase (alkaline phosphatase superfamily)
LSRSGAVRWLAPWLGVTAVAAVAMTAFDATLLHRRHAYFTGGFLSIDYVSTWPQAVAFFAGSLVADAAVLGVFIAIVLRVCSRLELSKKDSVILALMISLAPVVTADFLAYRLQSFLGDAFDFDLMFQLAGGNPAEILAVSNYQAGLVAAGLLAGVLVLAGLIWMLRRHRKQLRSLSLPSRRQAAFGCVAMLLVGAVTTTALRRGSDTLDNGLRRKPTGQLLGALVNMTSDVDRDGYGLLGRRQDPAPLDAAVHPFALDVPGNGLDEDALAGDLPAGLEPYREPEGPGTRWPAASPVVLIALESFRADAFGATVAGKAVTPVLDALAAAGASIPHAYSHNGYTVQSRQHFFSGSLAGLRGDTTLVDDFNAQGYETAYFSGQDESFGGPGADVGFGRASVSYDARQDLDKRYSTFSTAGSLAVPYDLLVDRVASFLKTRAAARPLFLYVNFHDTHFPYHHARIQQLVTAPVLGQSDIVPERAADLRAMYLNTAANVDAAIGRVLSLVADAVGVKPGVIVLADHGESLFDEGFLGHGYALNDAQTRIPMIVSGLPLQLVEPFGQIDLRDALRAALAGPASSERPIVRRDPDRQVFQYLGTIDEPAQIGLTNLTRRVLYDFRSRRARVGEAPWRRPEELSGADVPEFTKLIRLWERMMLARRDHAG